MTESEAKKRCLLAGHGDCRGKITGEHYISHALLKELSPGKSIHVTGTPWSIGKLREVGKTGLTANILCEAYNGGLSSLDAQAARFLKAIQTAQKALQAGSKKSSTHTFDGTKLERWFLKVCFTMWASGNLSHGGQKLKGQPPASWAAILVGNQEIKAPYGLYVQPETEPFATVEDEFEMTSLSGVDGSGVKAAHFKLARLPFTLIMGTPDDASAWGIFRPREIVLQNAAAYHVLRLRWPEGLGGTSVVYTRIGDAPANSSA